MSGKHGAGKGDNYRKVDQSKWDEGWEKAFGKKKKNKHKNIMQPGGVYDMTDIPQPENKKQWYEKDTKK